jgi:fructose-1,6-bisphosphatase/inositol monophosphatase family enzyme
MADDIFEARLKNFAPEGEFLAFNLAAVAEALDTIAELNEQNVGGETVEKRIGEFKSWDPEVFKVDKDTEDGYRRRIEASGRNVVLLSEEAGRLEINAEKGGQRLFCVCDPFDGSYLFKRGIPDFWYSSLSFYDEQFHPLCCAVGDGVHRKIAFASEEGAFIADLAGDRLEHKFELSPDYREQQMGRKHMEDFDGASIESYAMKPKKFLSPLVDEYREFLELFKFFLPNGGPYGFVDVAEGKIDCYFARRQPFVDIFSGILVAEKAGAVVTDFEGNPVKCSDNVKSVHDVVATTNETLHEKVLAELATCKAKAS